MSQFENVTIVKAANLYFDGKVTSRTILFPNGERKTLGILNPGEYTFGTEEKEIMELLAGDVQVKLPGETDFTAYQGGDTFEVPANASFDIKVLSVTDYCCSYIA
ncbi:pyrimidine/purine nucleoside phosphorylase [Aurantivibrio plasticivorans]